MLKIYYIPPKKKSLINDFTNNLTSNTKPIFDLAIEETSKIGISNANFKSSLYKAIKKFNPKTLAFYPSPIALATIATSTTGGKGLSDFKKVVWTRGFTIIELGQIFVILMAIVMCLYQIGIALKDGDTDKIWGIIIKFFVGALSVIYIPQLFLELARDSGITVPNGFADTGSNNTIPAFSTETQSPIIYIPEGAEPPPGYQIVIPKTPNN